MLKTNAGHCELTKKKALSEVNSASKYFHLVFTIFANAKLAKKGTKTKKIPALLTKKL